MTSRFVQVSKPGGIKKTYKVEEFLRRRAIENYILDDVALFDVIKKIGIPSFTTKDQIVDKLFELSEEQFEQTVADYFLYRNIKDIHPPKVILETKESAEAGLERIFQVRIERLSSNKDKISSELASIRNELLGVWKNGWLVYCDGREILGKFLNLHHSHKSFEDLRDMVSIIWDNKRFLPKDIEKIMIDISQFNR